MQPSLNQPPMSGDETSPAPGETLPPLSPELPARDAEVAVPTTETPPKDEADAGRVLLPKALVDDLYREARKNFALIPDMTFALAAGSRALRDMWEHKNGKFTRKDRPFANYIPPTDQGRASLWELGEGETTDRQAVLRAAKPPRSDWSPFGSDSESEDLTSGKRVRQTEDQERFDDYSTGNVATVVNDAVSRTSPTETLFGRAGMQVKGQGRYIWTRFGWVDLQHVVSAATATNDAALNLLLGLVTEGAQSLWPKYWPSAWKKEDLLSNWIGAQALARQRLVGGTIGDAVAFVLARYRPLTKQEAQEFLASGGTAEQWHDLVG